jgi:hypothetical protein
MWCYASTWYPQASCRKSYKIRESEFVLLTHLIDAADPETESPSFIAAGIHEITDQKDELPYNSANMHRQPPNTYTQ